MAAAYPLAGRLRGVQPLTDVGLALAQTVVALLLGSEYHDHWRPLDATGYVLVALASLPIAVRRQAPVTVLVCCAAAWFGTIIAGYWPALNPYGTMVALYTVTVERARPVAITAGALVATLWLYAALLAEQGSVPSAIAQAVVFAAVIWKFGDNGRKLVEGNEKLTAAATQLRREQVERARQAVVQERIRIAGELHDVVAHHMSVISVQAGMAGYVFSTDPESARTALDVIAANSRAAQEEMRRMLSMLRVDAPAADGIERTHRPAPGIARLDELADRMRASGVPTEVVTSGPTRPLPPGPDLCAYRVIQESLTNVLKHAQPASAVVRLEYRPDQFTAQITDNGRGTPANNATPGHGLIGMNERVRLYGGTLVAGPRPNGGFEVTLTLPMPDSRDINSTR